MAEPVVEHFGEVLRAGKYGHRLSRETYAIPNRRPSVKLARESISAEQWASLDWAFEDEEHTRYSEPPLPARSGGRFVACLVPTSPAQDGERLPSSGR